MMLLSEIQQALEYEMHGNGIARFEANNQRALDAGNASDTDWNRRLTRAFVDPFSQAVQAYIDYYKGRPGKPSRVVAYLKMLPPEVSAYVATKVLFDNIGVEDQSAQAVAEKIGRRVEDQVRFTKLDNAAPQYLKAIKEGLKKNKSQSYKHQHKVMVAAERKLSTADGKYANDISRWIDWPKADCVQIGAKLVDIFISNVLHNDEPVIKKVTKKKAGAKFKTVTYLLPSDSIVDWVKQYREEVGQMAPMFGPCVVPPRDWVTPFNGGYHTPEVSSKLPLVKCKSKSHRKRLTAEQMPKVYQCVNALQKTGWTISQQVLDVAQEVMTRDLAIGIPQQDPIKPRPAPIPEGIEARGKELAQHLTPSELEEFKDWKREAAIVHDAEVERRAKYMEAVRTLGQAEKYRDFDSIYFVYTLDFRGRVNCQSSLVSPQGGDLQKALIRFDEALPLGEDGRYWLAVQGAGVWGYDKEDFDERVRFINEMTEDILDFAAAPLTFKGWASADKPWQFLNWCFEWAALIEHEESGKPASTFKSAIPIAMDGSCSGIQHYSALLRDPIGGEAVNLTPSSKPQDIYGRVAEVVIDTLEGLKDSDDATMTDRLMARTWLSVGITRGLTKKAVMTLPYGSTQLSCRESIGDYLNDLAEKERKKAKVEGREMKRVHPFTSDKGVMNRFQAESWISSIVWKSIGKVVVAARRGMDFIKKVTSAVAKANKPLCWTTPTGFIVEQAIYKQSKTTVETQLMGRTAFTLLEDTKDIDPTKMQSSCAPNYIHSMDASHLALSVCGFEDAGITHTAVIHDSFGTHAGRTGLLRRVLPDALATMYEVCNWLEEFKHQCEDHILKEIPIKVPEFLGLDLNLIRQSPYTFA